MNDRFTQRVRKVLFLARDEAGRLQHEYIGTEHLLLGIIREGEGIAANVLRRLGIDFERIQKEIEATVSPMNGPVSIGEIPFTPRAKKVLELSIDEARLHNHNYVGTEHLLLALIREGEGIAADVLNRLGADHETVKREVMKALGATGGARTPGQAKKKEKKESPVLEQFGRNMTEMARQNQLDPTIGRDKEIERVIQILSRRKKNNPVLIGEPGVGKTAIVEGFASHIVENKVPSVLRDKEIVTLDLASVVGEPNTADSSRSASSRSWPRSGRTRTSSSSSTSCTPSSGPAAPRGPSTPRTCSSRRSAAARSSASARPPWTSTASSSRRTGPSSAASSR
jgi:ATP-dependent Clp protease ATP-binding subunit ClpC